MRLALPIADAAIPGPTPSAPLAVGLRRVATPAVTLSTATAACLLAVTAPASAQNGPPDASDGPVIHGYGAVFDVPRPDMATPTDREYRVVFDIAAAPEDPGELNRNINSVARFLNMHARAGVPPERMKLAVVLHGPAIFDVLRPEAFAARFGESENINEDLVGQLADAGVEFYMCGQSAASRGVVADDVLGPVRMALSAMTARAVLAERGYREVN